MKMMRLSRRALYFCLWLMALKSAVASPMVYSVERGDQLVLQMAAADIVLRGIPSDESEGQLRIFVPEQSIPSLRVVREEGRIEISQDTPRGRANLPAFLQQKKQEGPIRIEIQGYPLELVASLLSGSLALSSWSRPFQVNMVEGQLRLQGMRSSGSIQVLRGSVDIRDGEGRLDVEVSSAPVTVRGHQGDLQLDSFSGHVQLEKVRGDLRVQIVQGDVQVRDSGGQLRFDNGRGQWTLRDFEGRVEGANRDGQLVIHPHVESDLVLRTRSGRITLQAPQNWGASINLLTQEGSNHVPRWSTVNHGPGDRSVRGRFPGGQRSGSVHIRSDEGVVVLRQ